MFNSRVSYTVGHTRYIWAHCTYDCARTTGIVFTECFYFYFLNKYVEIFIGTSKSRGFLIVLNSSIVETRQGPTN